jgi:hypothetical protein
MHSKFPSKILAELFFPKLIVLNRILKFKALIFIKSEEKYTKFNILKRKKTKKLTKLD